jgi:CBS domain-containing protein
MNIRDILNIKNLAPQIGADLISIGAYDTIGQAVTILAENRIGMAIVRDDGGNLLGVLSERDLVNASG